MGGLARLVLAIGVSAQGVDFEAPDGEPVRVFFLLVSPKDAPAEHLQTLAAISRWLTTDDHVDRILGTDDPEEIHRLLRDNGQSGR